MLLSMNLDREDLKKSATDTPKLLASTIERVWEGESASECIIQHIKRFLCENIPEIISHSGKIAKGLGRRKGKRDMHAKETSRNQSGNV